VRSRKSGRIATPQQLWQLRSPESERAKTH
jgi:hypothetical protein